MSERTDHARELIEAVDKLLGEIDDQVAPTHRSGECECHDGVRLADTVEGLTDLGVVIEALRSTADFLEKCNLEGWMLEDAIKDGQVNLVRGPLLD